MGMCKLICTNTLLLHTIINFVKVPWKKPKTLNLFLEEKVGLTQTEIGQGRWPSSKGMKTTGGT